MVRIRGTIGDWPVDLTVELDDSDWAKLGAQVPVCEAQVSQVPAKAVNQDDALWETTKDLLRQAGQMTGPELLGQLEALTGSTGPGKRLLVRLRHCAEVKVVSGADSPIYSWVDGHNKTPVAAAEQREAASGGEAVVNPASAI